MNLLVKPSDLKGYVSIHPSKSLTHRAIICASFSGGISKIGNPLLSDDTIATINCLKKLGVEYRFYENHIIIDASNLAINQKNNFFECNESATTLRILLPILANFYKSFKMTGKERLIERVNTNDLLSLLGLNFKTTNTEIEVSGSMDLEEYHLKSDKTTQLISGMIFALAFMSDGTTLYLDDDALDLPYVRLTIETCKYFGLDFNINEDIKSISVKSTSKLEPREYLVEGDYSGAANFLAASIYNTKLKIAGLNVDSIQGDASYFNYLKKMGINYKFDNGEYSYLSGSVDDAVINITETPDLGPILVAIASLGDGTVIIQGTRKMNYKESNRVVAITDALINLGASIKVFEDEIIINGVSKLKGGVKLKTYNDHRIIMAILAISSRVEGDFIIDEFTGVKKSYPNFLDDFQRLGGTIEVTKDE